MKDRFKFRVFDTKEKVMHNTDFVITSTGYVAKLQSLYALEEDENSDKVQIPYDDCFMINQTELDFDKNCIVMQCTGLKDKYGKLIYEGDIVRLLFTEDDYVETRPVVYKDCAFQFNEPDSTQIDKPLYCFATNYLNHYKHIELEVIGNIYETPELLKR